MTACTSTLLPLPGETVMTPDSTSPDNDILFSMTSVELSQGPNIIERVNEELALLSEKTGMPVTQENGQRKYGPPKDCKIVPPKGCEVFVGKIPRDCFEPELVPVFERVGKIYEMRLMMDFSGTNRGYCFVQYFQPRHAQAACKELNHFEIRKGRAIGVVKSVDNCRLFIGGIPKDKTENDILEEVARITDGVVRVIVYSSITDKSKNRGFAFIEYENHKAAAMARRKMIPGKTPMWGMSMCVDWAEPEPDVDSEIMSKVQVLYARNLMFTTSEETLTQIFNEVSCNGVERVKKIKDYAFIHFGSRDQAEAAKEALNGTQIDGSPVEISWSKPVDKSTYKAQRALSRSRYSPGSRGLINGSVAYNHFYNYNPGLLEHASTYQNYHPVSHIGVLNQADGIPLENSNHYQSYLPISHAHPGLLNQMDVQSVQYINQQLQLVPGYQINRNYDHVYYPSP